jgi:hypothetical protein
MSEPGGGGGGQDGQDGQDGQSKNSIDVCPSTPPPPCPVCSNIRDNILLHSTGGGLLPKCTLCGSKWHVDEALRQCGEAFMRGPWCQAKRMEMAAATTANLSRQAEECIRNPSRGALLGVVGVAAGGVRKPAVTYSSRRLWPLLPLHLQLTDEDSEPGLTQPVIVAPVKQEGRIDVTCSVCNAGSGGSWPQPFELLRSPSRNPPRWLLLLADTVQCAEYHVGNLLQPMLWNWKEHLSLCVTSNNREVVAGPCCWNDVLVHERLLKRNMKARLKQQRNTHDERACDDTDVCSKVRMGFLQRDTGGGGRQVAIDVFCYAASRSFKALTFPVGVFELRQAASPRGKLMKVCTVWVTGHTDRASFQQVIGTPLQLASW